MVQWLESFGESHSLREPPRPLRLKLFSFFTACLRTFTHRQAGYLPARRAQADAEDRRVKYLPEGEWRSQRSSLGGQSTQSSSFALFAALRDHCFSILTLAKTLRSPSKFRA